MVCLRGLPSPSGGGVGASSPSGRTAPAARSPFGGKVPLACSRGIASLRCAPLAMTTGEAALPQNPLPPLRSRTAVRLYGAFAFETSAPWLALRLGVDSLTPRPPRPPDGGRGGVARWVMQPLLAAEHSSAPLPQRGSGAGGEGTRFTAEHAAGADAILSLRGRAAPAAIPSFREWYACVHRSR